MIERTHDYDWTFVHSQSADEFEQHLATFEAFTSVRLVSIYSDICKQEQKMSDTLQHPRLVALVDGNNNVMRYHECIPDPNSAHRIR